MRILLVTEKFNPNDNQRDGGTRLVKTLKRGFGNQLSIMQFDGVNSNPDIGWSFKYPVNLDNRFERRIVNAEFIARQVKSVEKEFTHIIFVHISMQFGFSKDTLRDKIEIWTFPMFLTPSYELSGESVPSEYTRMETLTLLRAQNILTPSYFEKKQLLEYYSVPEHKIHVIPRGVDSSLLKPIARTLDKKESPIFCSIGSIKLQKNTLELIDLFFELKNNYPQSMLRIIGPVQNQLYYDQVIAQINDLELGASIEFTGHIAHDELGKAVADCHLHISTSNCETFGRSIFETLAFGMPNIARLKNNAAAEFLQNLPYIKFVDSNNQALQAVEEILLDFPKLSAMASEIGNLYEDKRLSKLIVAKICKSDSLIISDYDGTLFHKNSSSRTVSYIEKFKQFSPRVICSARSTEDLLAEMAFYDLEVDWIISYSGAVITDGSGNILFINPLTQEEIKRVTDIVPECEKIIVNEQMIQISTLSKICEDIFGLNIETYQGKKFVANWQSSKLRAICKLLDHINWQGEIKTLGDGKYDLEYLTYFDGHLIQDESDIGFLKQTKEIKNAQLIL